MVDPKLSASGQNTSHAPSRVDNADSSTTLLVDSQAAVKIALLPHSKNSVFADKDIPQSFDLTIPNMHYGSRGPIKPIVDVDPLQNVTAVTTVSTTDTDQGATLPASIALTIGTTVNGLAGDANALATVVVSAIPLGATLSDGTHTFTASAGSTSVDVHSWNLAGLTVTPAADANFTLSVAATTRDAEGNLSTTTTATEAVTVNDVLDANNTVPGAMTGTQFQNLAIAGVAISDPDATGNVTTTLAIGHGTLTILTNVAGGVTASGGHRNGAGNAAPADS